MSPIDDDHYQLSSGRTFYANNGVIGIAFDDVNPSTDTLSYGADGGIAIADLHDPAEHWTLDEKRELANFMIETWTRWRDGWTEQASAQGDGAGV